MTEVHNFSKCICLTLLFLLLPEQKGTSRRMAKGQIITAWLEAGWLLTEQGIISNWTHQLLWAVVVLLESSNGESVWNLFLFCWIFWSLCIPLLTQCSIGLTRGSISHKPGLPASVVTSHSGGKESSLFFPVGHGLSWSPSVFWVSVPNQWILCSNSQVMA